MASYHFWRNINDLIRFEDQDFARVFDRSVIEKQHTVTPDDNLLQNGLKHMVICQSVEEIGVPSEVREVFLEIFVDLNVLEVQDHFSAARRYHLSRQLAQDCLEERRVSHQVSSGVQEFATFGTA